MLSTVLKDISPIMRYPPGFNKFFLKERNTTTTKKNNKRNPANKMKKKRSIFGYVSEKYCIVSIGYCNITAMPYLIYKFKMVVKI